MRTVANRCRNSSHRQSSPLQPTLRHSAMPLFPSTHIRFGGDYNPEQWTEDVWAEDMKLMREAGVNFVSLAIFAWSKLQSAPGVFHFEWLDRLMDLLAENGIQADLATATASPPHWLIRLHPEILPRGADGTVLSQGSRQHYHPSSRAYRAACAELVTALANHYKDHPALAMWHVNNEYACHVPADYGEESAAAFREWLRRRYGSLEALNSAWGTAFWSQHYYDWEEIQPPRLAPSFGNPGQALDFHRFSSDALIECYQREAEILRRITPNVPISTNFMEWFKPADYRKWAKDIDVPSVDIYPEPLGSRDVLCRTADMTRSWKDGVPWILMEQVTTHVNWRQRNATKPPGLMRLWSYECVARGADGICFFQWRQARAGAEKFHGSMVGHGPAEDDRCFLETKQLGQELARLPEVAGSRFHADAAIFFDVENWWALELPGKPNNDLKYHRLVNAFHSALLRRNIGTDFVFCDSELGRYKLVFVPTLYLVRPGVAEKLAAFVAAGGTVVLTYFSGIVDECDRVELGGYPAPFRDLLGLRIKEWTIPPDDRSFSIETTGGDFSQKYSASFWQEVVDLEGAKAVARIADGSWHNSPALTCHSFGQGEAWYLACDPEPRFFDDFIRLLAKRTGLQADLLVPDGVAVIRRTGAEADYLFLLNHNESVEKVALNGLRGFELLRGADVDGTLELEPRGVAILRTHIAG